MSTDLECPYCHAGLEINHDDGFGYEENVSHEMECDNCGKSFVFTTSISFYYEPHKADCLNDGKHVYEKTHTSPSCFSNMQCNMCGDVREMTEEERIGFGIMTKEEYFESLEKPC